MTEAVLLLACISIIGVVGLLGAINNGEWIYRSAGARLLTTLIGRSAMRVCTGSAGVVFITGPWCFWRHARAPLVSLELPGSLGKG